MIHEKEYKYLKKLLEGAYEPVYYEKTNVPQEMVSFLKTVRGLGYSYDWFMADTYRLKAIYNKEYHQYIKDFSYDTKEYLKLKKSYENLERLYLNELENEKEMEDFPW